MLAAPVRKTQVLFFCHHRHLLDIATAAIGPALSAVVLSPQAVEPTDALPERNLDDYAPDVGS